MGEGGLDQQGYGSMMTMESPLAYNLRLAVEQLGLDASHIEDLASQLIWRIGRVSDEGPVTIRVGFASSAKLFAELPRLRSASDNELEAAVRDGALRIEWVGHRPR